MSGSVERSSRPFPILACSDPAATADQQGECFDTATRKQPVHLRPISAIIRVSVYCQAKWTFAPTRAVRMGR